MSSPASPTLATIAAITPRGAEDADQLLRRFVQDRQTSGVHVRGLYQESCAGQGHCRFLLHDVHAGTIYPISQALGAASSACTLDPGALMAASTVYREIPEETALVVFNRFSGMESVGEGLADDMLRLMSEGFPVLVVVPERWLPAWRLFTGNLATELPAQMDALLAWFDALPARCPPRP